MASDLGVQEKKIFFLKNVAKENAPMPQMSRIGLEVVRRIQPIPTDIQCILAVVSMYNIKIVSSTEYFHSYRPPPVVALMPIYRVILY